MDGLWIWVKVVSATVTGALIELLDYDPKLIVLLSLLLIVDTITGMLAARRNGIRITSRGMRDTIKKILEYTALLITFSAIAAAFEVLVWMREAAFAYVALTEAKSIIENVYGERGVWESIMKMRGTVEPPPPIDTMSDSDALDNDLME